MKRDIGVLLGAMILKHFDDGEKINELMEEIGMKQIENELKIIAREEYKEELGEMEEKNQKLELENGNLKNKNGKYQKGIEQLKAMKDLNTPEAQKIINSLLML